MSRKQIESEQRWYGLRRGTMKRVIALAVLVFSATGLLYLTFYWLASGSNGGTARLDPVTFTPSPVGGETPRHAALKINALALIAWIALIGAYALGVSRLAARSYTKSGKGWLEVPVVTGVSLLYVAIVHPAFLLVVLPRAAHLAAGIEPLGRVYYYSRIREYALPIVLLHTILVCLSLAVLDHVRSARNERRLARRAQREGTVGTHRV